MFSSLEPVQEADEGVSQILRVQNVERILTKDVLRRTAWPLVELIKVFHGHASDHEEVNRVVASKINLTHISQVLHRPGKALNRHPTRAKHERMPPREATDQAAGKRLVTPHDGAVIPSTGDHSQRVVPPSRERIVLGRD